MSKQVELVVDAQATLGEGPIWDVDSQVLYWIDIEERELHVYDPRLDEDRRIDLLERPGTVVPRKSGGLMLAQENGFASFDLKTEQVTVVTDPESDKPENRFNDGKCDPQGRFWAGTMSLNKSQPTGSLYRLDPDLSVHKMCSDLTISNGICWSGDQSTMYYIDTPQMCIHAYDFDPATGKISNKRVAVTIPKEASWPDGMTIDAEDKLWVGHYGGGHVCRWDPHTGKQLDRIELPCPNVTACALGGPNLDMLYITTARAGMDKAALAETPLAGGLFRAKPGVKGVAAFAFAG